MLNKPGNILLTGATGFLGSILSNELSKQNVRYFTLSKSKGDYICDLASEIPHFNKSFQWIVHVAGKAHFNPRNSKEQQVFYDVNLEGTKNLVKGLESQETLPDSFIFISSVSVYGAIEGEGISEDYPLTSHAHMATPGQGVCH